MCGIAGFQGSFHSDLLSRAVDTLKYRGPDDSGTFKDPQASIGLAHTRLSIIDLSTVAKQPMQNETGSLTLVFNGEIYNYRELREELQGKGFVFKTHSDTEVLLHLYKAEGRAMLDRLNGMFAFALWDKSKRELFLARDGYGVKPLYYTENPSGFLFASELKALLLEDKVKREVNLEAMHHYLAYLWCPAPLTMLKNVWKLEPGHALRVKDGKVCEKWCFYDLPYGQSAPSASEEDLVAMLRERLQTAVERQMVADVQVGAFLSGGLDSSALVSQAIKSVPAKEFPCFTIAFDQAGGTFDGFANDWPYADQVAAKFGVPLHTVTVGSNMVDRLGDMLYALDEPQADPAPLNALFICELAREKGIKVLLSGAGGDDLFSGYRRHAAIQAERYWSWLPPVVRRGLKKGSRALPQNNTWSRRLERAFRFADGDDASRMTGYFLWMDDARLNNLYMPDVQTSLHGLDVTMRLRESLKHLPKDTPPLDQMLYLEAKHFLADHNLNYTDKMAMQASVEVRVPFLDPDLVALAVSLPPHLKQRGTCGKYLLKQAMRGILPDSIIDRPKSGFGVPLRQWMKSELRETCHELLGDKPLSDRGIFNPQSVKTLIHDNEQGKVDASYILFSIMCIEWWMRIFIDGRR